MNGRGLYARNNVTLLARVTASGGASAYAHETDSMAIAGSFRRYSKMLVQKNGGTSALFLSALVPYTTAPPVLFPPGAGTGAPLVRIGAGGWTDLVFCSQTGALQTIGADTAGMASPVKGNGRINLLSRKLTGGFASAFIQSGDSLLYGNQYVLRCSRKMDAAWMVLDTVLSAGYISDTGLVAFFSEDPLQLLRGSASSVSYDPSTHLVSARFTAPGNILFGAAGLTWVWHGVADGNWHNPANWGLPGHPSITGIPGASNQVIIPAGTPFMPAISNGPAACHDLTIGAGATLTVGSLKFLTVEGTLNIR